MSVEVMGKVWHVQGITAVQKLVLLAMADHAGPDGSHIYPSVARVASMTSCNERTVRKALKELQEVGLLVQVKKHTSRRPAEYRVDVGAVEQAQNTAPNSKKTPKQDTGRVGAAPTQGGRRTHPGWAQDPPRVGAAPTDPSYNHQEPTAIAGPQAGAPNGAQPPRPPDQSKPTPMQALMGAYKAVLPAGTVVAHGKEGTAAKRILAAGHSPQDAVACYQWLKGKRFWQDKHLSLQNVAQQMGAWAAAGRPGGNAQPVSEAEVAAENARLNAHQPIPGLQAVDDWEQYLRR